VFFYFSKVQLNLYLKKPCFFDKDIHMM
jgi:hypothetical protein